MTAPLTNCYRNEE